MLKQGTIHWIESGTGTVFVELKQIPNVIIVYRRPAERQANAEKVSLEHRNLQSVPLLEGEEPLKHLCLANNLIKKIDHLVSLPNLQSLDLSVNKIAEINSFWVPGSNLDKLRTLNMSRNQIKSIKNLDHLTNLEVLDLQDNRITELTGLHKLTNLRNLNLQSNMIETLELPELRHLVELNVRKNKISQVGKMPGFTSLSKLFLSHNQIKSIASLEGTLPALKELTLDYNPIAASV